MGSIRMRRPLALAFVAALAGAAACGDSLTGGTTGDLNPPALDLAGSVSGVDTVLKFSADARDNLGLKTIHVSVIGGLTFTFDTTFTSAVTSTNIPFTLSVPRSVPTGTSVTVIGFATDGSGNQSLPDTLRLSVGNVAPPSVRVVNPPSGTIAVPGLSVELSLAGSSGFRVRSLGYVTSGVLVRADSTSFVTPLRDSATTTLLLLIPQGTAPGELRVTPFLYDSLNQRSTGSFIILNVQTAASAGTVPTVTFGITPRIEITDTINVQASDPTGITSLGYEIRRAIGGAVANGMGDSLAFNGQVTSVSHRFTMGLPVDSFPTRVFVQAFARNSNGTRAYALLPSGAVRTDTVTVVAGRTEPLPAPGGTIADALYHDGKDRLYLTNIERNRVEVYDFATSKFMQGISVGSRPWGIAAWPRGRSGAMKDTLLVANSGGTSISYVALNPTLACTQSPAGCTVFTYALPNIIAYSVTSVESATVPGTRIPQRTVYDFSDRPQFLAATCRLNASPCGDVLLVYSTTPTGGQSLPFANRGSVRWENLSTRQSHFFFEHAIGQGTARSDTLEVERFAANGFGSDSVLVPKTQLLGSGADTVRRAITIVIERLGFRDTTFVRNSGDFRRAMLGEGGLALGSRSLYYDATRGMETTATDGRVVNNPVIDRGVSRAADVSDYIANAFARVKGVAINFDGELAAVRGDSTYLLDPTLRLQGVLQTSGGNTGFDFHPKHTGSEFTGLQNCYAFAASSEPVIEVYETRHYARVKTVPIRDPIIGPIKSALRPTGEIVLVGATIRGVVIVTLPSNFVSGCP